MVKAITKKLNNSTVSRFAATGVIATAIDFGLYLILTLILSAPIAANYISTGIAFCFSFFANKNYTFKTTSTSLKREILLFTIVTLVGIWIIQPVVIWCIITYFTPDALKTLWLAPIVAKLIATLFSLTWNYILYSKVVFVPAKPQHNPNSKEGK